MRRWPTRLAAVPLILLTSSFFAQSHRSVAKTSWRAATPAQLQAALPARAPVEKERIETEMPSASGIIDAQGHVIAAVVLITAGYAADGKYTHYLLVQAPLRVGTQLDLRPGSYVLGWTRATDGLMVHFYDAETGKDHGTILARPQTESSPVVPIRIWPPSDRSVIQIGRFVLPYTIEG
jgi:hypothetical protein